jgi:glycosyltransferase involved in cell wall biosynthesis
MKMISSLSDRLGQSNAANHTTVDGAPEQPSNETLTRKTCLTPTSSKRSFGVGSPANGAKVGLFCAPHADRFAAAANNRETWTMKLLFVHPVFAGQFHHQIQYLRHAHPGHQITFLSSSEHKAGQSRTLGNTDLPIDGVAHRHFKYKAGLKHKGAASVQRFADEIFQGKAVHDACNILKSEGYRPDIIVCHGRWGAGLFLKEVYPDVPLLHYSEFFSTAENASLCLEPGERLPEETALFYRLANASNLISLEAADHILTPTEFQKLTHPKAFHSKMSVIFDGIDSDLVCPGDVSRWDLGANALSGSDEIVTYVTRNFDPYRGFETFIKAAETLQRARPNVHFLIAGGAGDTGYGQNEAGSAYQKRILDKAALDSTRMHFLGPLDHSAYLDLLRFSQVHVYLTVPFVLSWSLIEAMSTGCAIVGSRTAPVEEVISDDDTGLLAGFHAPDELAAQIMTLLDDPARRLRLGQAARQRVIDDFSIASEGPRFAALIRSLAS